MAALAFLPGLVWARPLGALTLVLPVIVYLLLRWNARPAERVTGTARLWSELGERRSEQPQHERRRLPRWAWFLIGALLLGSLALLGPRRADPPAPRTWRVVVDSSPSMQLPDPAGLPRVTAGLARANELLRDVVRRGDRVLWTSPGRPDLDLGPGETPPADWSEPLDWVAEEPSFGNLDRAGVLFVTDWAPEPAPRRAGLVVTGAVPSPGPVGHADGRLLVFDGVKLTEGEALAFPLSVAIEAAPGTQLPAPLERVLAAWLGARGYLRATPERRDAAALRLVLEGSPSRTADVGRDGWWSRARVTEGGLAPATDGAPEEVWLEDADGAALVRAAPGRLRLALHDLGEPAGDPASFAVSFGRLFDGSLGPLPGVVPLAERTLVASPQSAAPRWPTEPEGSGAPGADPSPIDAWLAAAAGILCLAGLTLRGS